MSYIICPPPTGARMIACALMLAATDASADLVSGFASDADGWTASDPSVNLSHQPAGGASGGYLSGQADGGVWSFVSPAAWAGDWSAFSELRFDIRWTSNTSDTSKSGDDLVTIFGANGSVLKWSFPLTRNQWERVTLPLDAASFGVDQATFEETMAHVSQVWIRGEFNSGTDITWYDNIVAAIGPEVPVSRASGLAEDFDSVMANVAHVTIMADLVNGLDTTRLDSIALDSSGFPAYVPDNQFSGFDSSNEGWRKGGRNSTGSVWTILTQQALHNSIEGNPPGSITIDDEGHIAYWFSPESWAGDWRGLNELSFDLKILVGTSLLAAGDMIRIFSPHGTLTQNITTDQLPELDVWNSYQFELSAAAFGVSEDLYQRIMRDVSRVGIRSEWISGAETEALDNVLISKGDPDYWAWISNYLDEEEAPLLAKSGPTADLDGDGISNFDEFIFLTAPNDATDRFTPVFAKVPGGWEYGFVAKSGRSYQLQHSPDLGQAVPWLPYGSEIIGDDTSRLIPIPMDGPVRFFRVSVSR